MFYKIRDVFLLIFILNALAACSEGKPQIYEESAYIKVAGAPVIFDHLGGEKELVIDTNIADWKHEAEDPGNNFKFSRSGLSVKIIAGENNSENEISATVSIVAPGHDTIQVVILQAGYNEDQTDRYLDVDNTPLHFLYDDDARIKVDVDTHDSLWEINKDCEWITTVQNEGHFIVWATSNIMGFRTGTITVSASGCEAVIIRVTQDGNPDEKFFTIDNSDIIFSSRDNEPSVIQVDTNIDNWSVSTICHWLEFTKEAASLTVTAKDNAGGYRAGVINVNAGGQEITIEVSQEGAASDDAAYDDLLGSVTVTALDLKDLYAPLTWSTTILEGSRTAIPGLGNAFFMVDDFAGSGYGHFIDFIEGRPVLNFDYYDDHTDGTEIWQAPVLMDPVTGEVSFETTSWKGIWNAADKTITWSGTDRSGKILGFALVFYDGEKVTGYLGKILTDIIYRL